MKVLVVLAVLLGGALCWWAVKENTRDKEAKRQEELEQQERREAESAS